MAWDPASKVYWTDGYYADRIAKGERPQYFVSNATLPIPLVEEMEIKTSYLEALRKNNYVPRE